MPLLMGTKYIIHTLSLTYFPIVSCYCLPALVETTFPEFSHDLKTKNTI